MVAELKIIEADEGDLGALVELYQSMQEFYGAEIIEPALSEDRLRSALSSIGDGFVLIAIVDKPVGFATVAPLFPASDLEITWYLKDLYAIPDVRGSGVGSALILDVAKKVVEKGGTRLDFTTDAQNIGAQAFYKQLDAAIIDKVYYRYDRDDLKKLANKYISRFQ